MPTVLDVAEYILAKQGATSAMKLQKLCYYAQAWSLVWDDRPLFDDRIEAWANGPVSPPLYNMHSGQFQVTPGTIQGKADALDAMAKETIDRTIDHYGHRSPQWLSDLTHAELPWKDARGPLSPGARSNALISTAAMAEYYGSL